GGVINLFTEEGGGRPRGAVLAEGGGLGMFRGLATLAGGAKDDRLRYSGGLSHLNVTRGIDGQDRYRNHTGQGFAQWALTPTATLGGRLFGSTSYLDLNDLPYPAPNASLPAAGFVRAEPGVTFFPNPNDPDYQRHAHFFSGLTTFQHRLSRGVSYRLGYQGLITDRDNRDGPAGTRSEPARNNSSRFASRMDTVQGRVSFEPGRFHMLTGGWEFEREYYDNQARDAVTNAGVRAVQRSHTLFLHDQARFLSDRLQVSVSGRWQRFTLDRPKFTGGEPLYLLAPLDSPPDAWTGDAALAWFVPRTNTKFRAHAGNGYRVPSLYERFAASFFGGSFFGFGEPRLRPERTIAFDAGIDQYLAGGRMRVSGSGFYTRLQEVIGFGAFSYLNTGGGLARGVELSVEARPKRALSLRSSYTYTNADERNSRLIGGTLRVIRVYDHMFTLSAAHSWKRWDYSFDFLAAGDYLSAFFVGTGSRGFVYPGPRKADVVAGYTVPVSDSKHLRFFFKVENLFNQVYFEDGFRTPKAWAIGGLRLTM
ncbi:MAG: TonB-dependent receptor plug domain-containing protein, partial [Bryobacteraceae bacterium]